LPFDVAEGIAAIWSDARQLKAESLKKAIARRQTFAEERLHRAMVPVLFGPRKLGEKRPP
jgi:hypothetical protein